MQRVVVTAFNPADPTWTLKCEQAPVPKCAAGEVLVRVTARPVNPADIFSIMVRASSRTESAAVSCLLSGASVALSGAGSEAQRKAGRCSI